MIAMTYKNAKTSILTAFLAITAITIIAGVESGYAIPYKSFSGSVDDGAYSWKLGTNTKTTLSPSNGNMDLYAKGPVSGQHPPQVGAVLTKPVSLNAGQSYLVEVSGIIDCDWINISQVDATHCFVSAHIQEQNTRPGTIPSWCQTNSDVIGYGEQTNKRIYRESPHALSITATCTPPTSGTYDVVIYGHVVAGDNSRDYTSLKIKSILYNVI